MSAQDIIAELPKLKPEELQLVKARVEALEAKAPMDQQRSELRQNQTPIPCAKESLAQFLLRVAGTAGGLPQDLVENHEHYLYGTPKRVRS